MSAVLPPESVLIVRLGAMGDVIHTLTAVSALRNAFPQMRIGWVVEERWAELLYGKSAPRSGPRNPSRPIVDFVHVVNTKRWRKSPLSWETRQEFSAVLRELRDQEYGVVADFQGALKSAFIARLARGEIVLGFEHPRESPARIFYKHRLAPEGAHVIEHYRSLAKALAGTSLLDCAATFPSDEEAAASIAKRIGPLRKFVLMSPGAGWRTKEWPPDRYGLVAQAIARDGLDVLINFGPGEQDLARRVEATSNGAAHSICCSISELIALTRQARLFIGGDTGPLHLAAALKVPVVAIFGPTDPARNGPYETRNVVLRDAASKTSLSHTSSRDPGLQNVTAEKVIAAARQLLANPDA